MIQHGDTVIMKDKELEQLIHNTVVKAVELTKEALLMSKPERKTLDTEGVMKLFHKTRPTIRSYKNRKRNPLPMVGDPPLIEENVAWEWYVNHSGDYQPE